MKDNYVTMYIGPFFRIGSRFIYNAIPLSEGRRQADKIDNSYGHDQLFSDHFKYGDYINYPRGRVIWDTKNERAIIYIDPCINNEETVSLIKEKFELEQYVVRYDEHYRCRNCIGQDFKIWTDDSSEK